MKYFLALPLLLVGIISSKAQLKIADNTHLVVTNGVNLVINDLSLFNGNQNLSGAGRIFLTGISNTNEISSVGRISNITINKSGSATIKLTRKLDLSSSLEFISGKLDLNSFDLDLGSTGTLSGESESSHVTGNSGFITREADLNNPSSVNPGNLGVGITSAANLGITTIKRGNYTLSDGSNYTINRFFDITPSNNTNLNATIRFNYLDANLGPLQESNLKFLASNNSGTNWSLLSGATINTAANYAEQSGLNSLGRYSLANEFTTLPISSISLTGKQNINGINLKWYTLGEAEVSHFWLEKSTDGKNFRELSRVASLSNVRKDNIYEALDRNPFKGINYYRVRSVDFDGATFISAPAAINFELTTDNTISLYPNPTAKNISISFYNNNKALTTIEIVSVLGKTVLKNTFAADAGLNSSSFDVSHLTIGTYFVTITNNTLNKTLKFIKN